MEHHRKRRTFVSAAESEITALDRGVKGAHMITDRQKLGDLKSAEEPLQDDTALFAVTDGEFFVDLIDLLFHPLTARLILDVAISLLVKIHLANVMEKRTDGDAFVRHGIFGIIFRNALHAIVDVQRMFKKPAGIISVKFRAGRCFKKVALFKPIEDLVKSLALDIRVAYFEKSFFVCHITPPYPSLR